MWPFVLWSPVNSDLWISKKAKLSQWQCCTSIYPPALEIVLPCKVTEECGWMLFTAKRSLFAFDANLISLNTEWSDSQSWSYDRADLSTELSIANTLLSITIANFPKKVSLEKYLHDVTLDFLQIHISSWSVIVSHCSLLRIIAKVGRRNECDCTHYDNRISVIF